MGHLSFQSLVWLGAAAFCVHVAEEFPRFIRWAQQHVNPQFTRGYYLKIHVGGIVAGFAVALLLSNFRNTTLVFLYFAILATPSYFWNTVFHTGAMIAYGGYCPGAVTSVVLYLPLYMELSRAAVAERLISTECLLLAALVAGVLHALEVRRNVYLVGRAPASSI